MHIARFAAAHRLENDHRMSELGERWRSGKPFILTPASFKRCVLEDVHLNVRATIADRPADFEAARLLVAQRYTARGYRSMCDAGRPCQETHAVTILAARDSRTVGTMTLRFDSSEGLNVDEAYRTEVNAVRAGGGVVCELTCLAVAQGTDSHAVLAVLFRMAFYVADKMGVTDVFIEVNPRHERFYRRVLGFAVAAEQRLCPRVQAPAVLLHQDMVALGKRLGGFPPPTEYGTRALAAT